MRLVFLATALLAAAASAQDLDPALAPFARLVGEWEGPAEAVTREGRVEVFQTERVRAELGGRLMTVEGIGRRLGADGDPGDIAFHAFGVFSVDAETGTVYLDAFTKEGRHTRVAPVVTDDGFEWSITPESGPRIHYVMRFDDEGRWVETGAYSLDGGTTWTPFFEMTLARTDGGS